VTSVRLGLLLTPQHPEAADPVAALHEHLALVHAARDAGFATVLVSHHYLAAPYAMLQPVPLLARIAAEAGEMRIGTGVLLATLPNPLQVAEEVATLDVIAGGRTVLGVGLGYRAEERDAFGVPHDRAARVYLDKLDVVRRLLQGEQVTAEGPGYRLAGARLTLRPLQRPRPPIWMAANTDAGVRRAARHADAWLVNPHARLAEAEAQAAAFRHLHCREPGQMPVCREVCVAATDEEAAGVALPALAPKYGAYVDWGQSEAMPTGDTLDRAWDDLREDRFVIGSPATAAAALRRIRDRLGATDLLARVTWPGLPLADALRTVRLLGEEVVPAL
jgi:alkanesulfonate monooxygenase SsuD/methylene tetrahydromethanopterin reductase-like flavin-dependent oxidoreductase (luciferase family)